MDKCIFTKLTTLLLSLVLLSNSIQHAATSSDEINIIPAPDSPCPGASKGEPCFTLQQFIANHTAFSANTTLKFYPGNHLMDSQLSISYVNSFAMWAIKTATIFCRQPYGRYLFRFLEVNTVQISGITFNGCRLYLKNSGTGSVTTIIKSSFINKTKCCSTGGGVLAISSSGQASSVLIKQCLFSNNTEGIGVIHDFSHNLTVDQCTFKNNYDSYSEGGAIYKDGEYVSILNSHFSHNKDIKGGGAVFIIAGQATATIANCYFSDNVAGAFGGAVMALASPVVVTNCYFTDNITNNSLGGALYVYGSNGGVIITESHFSDNVAGPSFGNGGAVYIEGGGIGNGYHRDNQATEALSLPNVTMSGNTFEHNVASSGGGAIYSGVRYSSISLTKNTFSHNTAANCGAVKVSESYILHFNASFIGNIFTHNRAIGLVDGNNGGGGMCINRASALISNNTFSHNSAAGDAGALRVDADCDIVTIERSRFSNNAAQGNGGVILAYNFSTNYTITHSSFSNNRAGGDGGVMYVESTSSQVKIYKGTFSYNLATNRGGVIAINGSSLLINGANICNNNNTADLGGVVSACKSKVRISHPKIPATPDPIHSFCTLYDC